MRRVALFLLLAILAQSGCARTEEATEFRATYVTDEIPIDADDRAWFESNSPAVEFQSYNWGLGCVVA